MSEYIKNQATITYNNNVTETTEVVVTDIEPKIEITKRAFTCTDRLITHKPGSTATGADGVVGSDRIITYTFDLRNDSSKDKTDVKLYDDLNLAMADYEILEAFIEADHKEVTYVISDEEGYYSVQEPLVGTRIAFDIGTLPANTEIVLTYTIKLKNDTIAAGDVVNNRAKVTDSENTDPEDPDTPGSEEVAIEVTDTTVKPNKQLMVLDETGKLVPTSQVSCGEAVTYRITVPNPTPENLILNSMVDQFAALFNLDYTGTDNNKVYSFDIKLVKDEEEVQKEQGTGEVETDAAKDYLVEVEEVTDSTSKVIGNKVKITNSHTQQLKEGSTTEYEPLDKDTITTDMKGINIPAGYTLQIDIPGKMKCEKTNQSQVPPEDQETTG